MVRISLGRLDQKIDDLMNRVDRGFNRTTEKFDKLFEISNKQEVRLGVVNNKIKTLEKDNDSPLPNMFQWFFRIFR